MNVNRAEEIAAMSRKELNAHALLCEQEQMEYERELNKYREALKRIADLHIRGIEDKGANEHRRIAKKALE